MIVTLLSSKSGVLITKPTETFTICEDLKKSLSVTRFGNIKHNSNEFEVVFCLPALQVYNKSGFATREDAVAYEQTILDEHLSEFID